MSAIYLFHFLFYVSFNSFDLGCQSQSKQNVQQVGLIVCYAPYVFRMKSDLT